jgi:hypothetical protein
MRESEIGKRSRQKWLAATAILVIVDVILIVIGCVFVAAGWRCMDVSSSSEQWVIIGSVILGGRALWPAVGVKMDELYQTKEVRGVTEKA